MLHRKATVWAVSFSLAATKEMVHLRDCFLFLQVLKCFTSLSVRISLC